MEHQQWERIEFKKPIHKMKNTKIEIQNKVSDETKSKNSQNQKIENETENFSIQKIPTNLSKEIIKLRCEKKISQKDLSQQLNIQPSILQEIESGKSIYNHDTKKIIQKIEKLWKITFLNK